MTYSAWTPLWTVTMLLLLLSSWCTAKTVTYDFNVTWVTANPDGLMQRKVVGINGQWPLPTIEVDKGDQLIVNMHNGLGDKNATIHFHGMFQNGTNYMDGPSMVTQCPVPPGYDFTYNFTVNQNGTYWYHCHTDFCYPDGYRQALIVHDSDAYFKDEYEEEIVVTVSDWYHELVEGIAPDFLSLYNPTGAEPIPDAFLFNDTLSTSIPVKPNTTYLIRLINVGAFVAQYFYIEDHTFQIVEIDGVYTEPTEAEVLYIAVAQRYSILLTTKTSTDKNYAIVTVADSVLLDTIPSDLRLNNTNWLQYNQDAPHLQADITVDQASDLIPFDDITLVPYDHMPLLPDPDYVIDVTVYMEDLGNGKDYALLNNISYTAPKVPTLFSVLSSGDLATNSKVYGEFTHSFVLNHNDVVQVVLNNGDTGSHPFHLHGHNFQVIDRAPSYGPTFYNYLNGNPVPYDPNNHTAFPSTPARRDVFVLPPQGYFVIRFVADNPGVWFFHCHIDWHLSQGLGLLLIEAPTQMQERLSIPQQHYDVCQAAGVPSKGNAAANTENFLDLTGQNTQQPFLPDGFTPRGIVALVFSCISALMGIAFLVVYGLSDLKFHETQATDGNLGTKSSKDTSEIAITEGFQD
ncbi:MAG: ferroxidase fet3 [Icmadophila ericetorum]|nr:ferroxidase fet3 [Icmadophila ericetorum]